MSDRRHSGVHPGPHPDADQLTAFMEGALTAKEREESLAHLAECAECRSIVFLAQEPTPLPPLKEPTARLWRRWTLPLAFAGTAVACAMLVVLLIRPHHTATPPMGEVAVSHQPAHVPPSISAPAPRSQAPLPAPEHLPERRVAEPAPAGPPAPPPNTTTTEPSLGVIGGLVAGTARPAARPGRPVTEATPAGETATLPSLSAPPPSSSPAPSAQQAPALTAKLEHSPAAAPSPPATEQMAARSFAQMRATSNLVRSTPALTITIEHDRGPDDGFSQVAGSVADSTGAVVPGATITLHGSSVSAPPSATTGADGRFTLSAVPAGHYDLQVSSPGFQPASQPIDLHPRDLALLTSVLHVGASAQTVQVTGANAGLLTTSTEVRAPLPSKLPATTTVVSGDRVLALDSAGTLFLNHNAGKHWKRIKPEWPGNIAQLALADHPPQDELRQEKKKLSAAPLFQLTTTTGDVWLSTDGVHWRPR